MATEVFYCFVLLNEMACKAYINFPLISPLWKENEFSFIFSKMNWQFIVYEPLAQWQKLLIENIFNFFNVFLLLEDICVICMQIGACVW